MEESIDGEAWVLVGTSDDPNDLMILNSKGEIMKFKSRQEAEDFKEANGVPDNMKPAQVHELAMPKGRMN